MKRYLLSIAVLLLSVMSVTAHDPQKFSPEKFQADMEQFITKEASLTAEEAARAEEADGTALFMSRVAADHYSAFQALNAIYD